MHEIATVSDFIYQFMNTTHPFAFFPITVAVIWLAPNELFE